jgi:hypothetical protein
MECTDEQLGLTKVIEVLNLNGGNLWSGLFGSEIFKKL